MQSLVSDVHYVITEYGIAYLFGRSIRERALALIEIAHPKFRPWLLDEAKRLGYVRKEQSLKSSVSYPIEEERRVVLKNGETRAVAPGPCQRRRKPCKISSMTCPKTTSTRASSIA